MNKNNFVKLFAVLFVSALSVSTMFAQKRAPLKPLVFAVIGDGGSLEPIAAIEKGKLVATSDGGDDAAKILKFTRDYYKPNSTYRLVFGGVDAGTVTVKSSDPKAECSKNMAKVTTVAAKAKLKGNVMGLAANAGVKKGDGLRRLPTAAERTEIESLVRAEFFKNKISDNIARKLKYHNLTALDVDADGKPEMVGSFWVEPSVTERAMLFFIADKGANGKYSVGYSDFGSMKKEEMMEGSEISMVDEGVYHELLLDALDTDGDKANEIFTYTQSLEGASFNAYSRRGGKWEKVYEGANYHCGF